MRYTQAIAGAALFLLSLQGAAEAKVTTIAQLKTLVADLGYESQSDDKTYVSISEQGKWNVTISMLLRDNGQTLEIYTNLGTIPDGGQATVPYSDMLSANDDSPFSFAVGRVQDKPTIFQESFFDTTDVNKQMLRKTLDAWLVRVETTEPIWGQDHWKVAAVTVPAPTIAAPPSPAPASPSPATAKLLCDPSVEKGPLTIRGATFRTAPDAEAAVRADHTFGLEEKMYIVLEVTGFQCSDQGSGQYQASLKINQEIKKDTDKDYDHFASFTQNLNFAMTAKGDRAFVDQTLTPHWNTPGTFSFKYSIHDELSGQNADVVLPMSIAQ